MILFTTRTLLGSRSASRRAPVSLSIKAPSTTPSSTACRMELTSEKFLPVKLRKVVLEYWSNLYYRKDHSSHNSSVYQRGRGVGRGCVCVGGGGGGEGEVSSTDSSLV